MNVPGKRSLSCLCLIFSCLLKLCFATKLTFACLLKDEINERRQVNLHQVIQREIPVLWIFGREFAMTIRISITTPVQEPDVVPE